MNDPAEMEEPIPCVSCGKWVELQETRTCPECRELVCMACLRPTPCAYCRGIQPQDDEGDEVPDQCPDCGVEYYPHEPECPRGGSRAGSGGR